MSMKHECFGFTPKNALITFYKRRSVHFFPFQGDVVDTICVIHDGGVMIRDPEVRV